MATTSTPAPRPRRPKARTAPDWYLAPEPAAEAGSWALPGSPLVEVKLRATEDAGMRVSLAPSARDALRAYVEESPGRETGGVVLGTLTPGRRYITHLCPPGPAAVRTATSLIPDGGADGDLVAAIVASTSGQVREVGHWHHHPSGVLRPSGPDLDRMGGLAHVLGVDRFLELIVGPPQRAYGGPRLSAWVTRPTPADPWDYVVQRGEVIA